MTKDKQDPIGTTPTRLADELVSIGVACYKLRLRARALRPFLGAREELGYLVDALLKSTDIAVDLGSAIRAAAVPIRAALMDSDDVLTPEQRARLRRDIPAVIDREQAERDERERRNGLVELPPSSLVPGPLSYVPAAEPPPKVVALPTDAEERRAAKKEADRKYRERKKAAAALDRAIGNRVESPASPPNKGQRTEDQGPTQSVREPVIAGPSKTGGVERGAGSVEDQESNSRTTHHAPRTTPEEVERLAPESPSVEACVCNKCNQVRPLGVHPCQKCGCPEYRLIRVAANAIEPAEPAKPKRAKSLATEATAEIFSRSWEAYDLRQKPPALLGEVKGNDSTRAIMAAEAAWPDVPARLIEIREKTTRSRRKRSEVGP